MNHHKQNISFPCNRLGLSNSSIICCITEKFTKVGIKKNEWIKINWNRDINLIEGAKNDTVYKYYWSLEELMNEIFLGYWKIY